MKSISELTKNELKKIKLIIFDVDGVLVKRGTKIKQKDSYTSFETKKIEPKQIEVNDRYDKNNQNIKT